jgi:lauroyl/myristoyl acyltransferase
VLAGAHTCSFDFLLTVVGVRFPDVLFLTKPGPKGSSEVMNRIRRGFGLDLSPISAASLREAIQRLREGGIVVIAADVPTHSGSGLTFFGRPSALSDGFTRIALAAEAELMVGFSHRLGDGEYEGIAEVVVPPAPGRGRQELARRWAQRALVQLEGLLEQYPEDWLMPQPIWPSSKEGRAAACREPRIPHRSPFPTADVLRDPNREPALGFSPRGARHVPGR